VGLNTGVRFLLPGEISLGGSHSGIQQKETWLQVKMKNDEDSAKLTVTVAVSLLTESQI
jgi:hypothetical protein